MQQPCKWPFTPNFFSSSKWAQFLHVNLDLTGKHCPVIFSAVLFFVFEKFFWTSTGSKCALRWFYCLEKQKLSLERTPPGKKTAFLKTLFVENERETSKLKWVGGGGMFFSEVEGHMQKLSSFGWGKKFDLKSHLHGCCRKPFNYKFPVLHTRCNLQGATKQMAQGTTYLEI